VSHSDTDGYRILNFRNFRIRIGYGYEKKLSDMDQELKNHYPLASAKQFERKYKWTNNERPNGQRVKPAHSRLKIIVESSNMLIRPVQAQLYNFSVIRIINI